MRGFYRSYPAAADQRSKRITRFHVVRETGAWAGRAGYCGQRCTDSSSRAWDRGPESVAVIVDPLPIVPPAGLRWCGPCLGGLAVDRGRGHAAATVIVPDAGSDLVPTGLVTHCCGSHRRRSTTSLGDGIGSIDDVDRLKAQILGRLAVQLPVERRRLPALGPCCDPEDCGPCCPECPTCPTVAAQPPADRRARAAACRALIADLITGREHRLWDGTRMFAARRITSCVSGSSS